MKSKKNMKNKIILKKKKKYSQKGGSKIIQNFFPQSYSKPQIIVNKNGKRSNTDEFQSKITNITNKAFKYSQNAKILGNYIFLQELNKNL